MCVCVRTAVMGTGADFPETITHAFVLNGFCWIKCKGNLEACPTTDQDTLRLVRESAYSAKLNGNIFKTLGYQKYPAQYNTFKKRKANGVISTDKERDFKRLSYFLEAARNKRFKMGRESPA